MPQIREKLEKLYTHSRVLLGAFVDKELTLYAASLSFYTIFTIIPLLLIMTTLLTSLPSFSNIYAQIQKFLFSNLMPVNSELIMNQINGFLQNSAEMGVVSFAMVIVSSLLFFQNFEYITTKIFHSKKRTFWDSITTYWTLLTLTPLGLGVSFYITGHVATLLANNVLTSGINILPMIPYVIIWGLFFVLFQIAANIKINIKATLISSFATSLVFGIAKNAFIYYVFYNKSYATMYGSFSIVMFLFLWIYFSWIIFIYGLKLCYLINRIYENREAEKR